MYWNQSMDWAYLICLCLPCVIWSRAVGRLFVRVRSRWARAARRAGRVGVVLRIPGAGSAPSLFGFWRRSQKDNRRGTADLFIRFVAGRRICSLFGRGTTDLLICSSRGDGLVHLFVAGRRICSLVSSRNDGFVHFGGGTTNQTNRTTTPDETTKRRHNRRLV